jgi:rhamnosyltransferase
VTTPRVSVVLPTRNGAATLPAVVDALSRQRVDFPFEIVAVDCESSDGTADLLRPRVDRFISIPAGSFDHGLTRNLGVEHARGELVVLLVQDALPASDQWLAALTSPLFADATLAGVFARQRPRPEADALTRHYLAHAAASAETGHTAEVAGRVELAALDPMERLVRCTFDNVCSCIRRSVWTRIPFKATPIAEDLEWARDVLLAGYRLAYVPQATVIHSHDRSARYEFTRTYLLHRRLFELFEVRTIPTLAALARAIATSLAVHLRCLRATTGTGALSAIPVADKGSRPPFGRAMALAFAWPLGQYLGALSAVRGWKPFRSRMV